MIKEVKTLDDLVIFTKEFLAEGIAINPDDDFAQMKNVKTEKSTFKPAMAEMINSLVSQCFKLCEQKDISIYDFMQEIYLKETGLDKFIPLPSETI